MKLQITNQNLDHAPRAIASLRRARLDSAECTAAGSRQAVERSIAKSVEREAYMRAIQDCLRSGGNPVSDVDMPFRPDHELTHIPQAPERTTRWSEALQTWITS